MSAPDLDELRLELADFAQPEKPIGRSPLEERIVAGFEEIQRFVETNGRVPQHGENRDISERLFAVRLDRLRAHKDARLILQKLDHQKLLENAPSVADAMNDDELMAELTGPFADSDIAQLRLVRTNAERRAAEEIASRQVCEDFDRFRGLFQTVQREIETGVREARPFELKAEIGPGSWFIVGGRTAYVAEMEEVFTNAQGRTDARLRVIFDNGTESNMLMRSLQRALHKDDAGRRITDPVGGPLFSDVYAVDDTASGTIYVLRSKSDHPLVVANRDLVHKIGVTNMSVAQRVAGARLQPTFLMADVEIVATYELYNIGRSKLERLIHRVFEPARLDIEVKDRFGQPVVPREWFLVPLFVIDEAVDRIKDGSITTFRYDPNSASLKLIAEAR